MNGSGDRPESNAKILVCSLGILAALALSAFLAYYSLDRVPAGRDVVHHVTSFLWSVVPKQDGLSPFHRFFFYGYAPYGPAIKLVTLPVWLLLGTWPATFGAANLLVFFLTIALLALILHRLGTDPAWILVLGALILGSELGMRMYLLYNIDAVYTLAALFAFHVAFARDPASPVPWTALGAAVLVGLLARPNTLAYLLVPVGYRIFLDLRRRPDQTKMARREQSLGRQQGWLALSAGLLVVNLWYYLPALDDILHHLVTSPDFRPENSRVAGGLWTVENWTWFLRTLPAMVAPGICALLLPFSAIGWWRGFPGRRVAVLLFLFVPIVGFSLIIGVRNPEYIAPSVILSLLFAMHGISRVRRVGFRMAIVTVILFLGLSQFWVGVFGFQPIPRLAPQSFSNRLVRAMLSNPTNYIAPLKPAFRDVGDYKLLHRLLSTMFQEDEKATVCILNTSEKMNIDMCYAILSPIFEKKPTCVNVAKLSEPSCIGAFPCDALLVFDDDVGEGKTEALDDMIEADFRKAISLTIFHRIYVHVYLPGDNPHGDT